MTYATQEQLKDDNWGAKWSEGPVAVSGWCGGCFDEKHTLPKANGFTRTGSLKQAREYAAFLRTQGENDVVVRHFPDGAKPDPRIYDADPIGGSGTGILRTWEARIGSYDYSVFIVTAERLKTTLMDAGESYVDGDEGFWNSETREIFILKQDTQRMQDTYVHEVLHACDDIMGLDLDETQVKFLAALLGSAMRDAPSLEDE